MLAEESGWGSLESRILLRQEWKLFENVFICLFFFYLLEYSKLIVLIVFESELNLTTVQ